MPVHVEEMTSDVAVLEGELPLTEAQINKLVKLVLKRWEEQQREAKQSREATSLRQGVTSPAPMSE